MKKVHYTPSRLRGATDVCLPIRRFEIGLGWIQFEILSNEIIVIDGSISSGKTCLKVVKLDGQIKIQGWITDFDIAVIQDCFHQYRR